MANTPVSCLNRLYRADDQRGWEMTLLGAVMGDGYVLLAGDTAALYHDDEQPAPGYTNATMAPVHKCLPVGDRPLVWGLCGTVDKSKDFQDWIEADRSESWGDLVDGATQTVQDVNEKLRRGAQSGRKKQVPEMSVIIAGYVGDAPDIAAVTKASGGRVTEARLREAFHGPFCETARTTWHVLHQLDSGRDLRSVQGFRSFMDALSSRLPAIGWPVDLWEITPNGCREVGMSGNASS